MYIRCFSSEKIDQSSFLLNRTKVSELQFSVDVFSTIKQHFPFLGCKSLSIQNNFSTSRLSNRTAATESRVGFLDSTQEAIHAAYRLHNGDLQPCDQSCSSVFQLYQQEEMLRCEEKGGC